MSDVVHNVKNKLPIYCLYLCCLCFVSLHISLVKAGLFFMLLCV